MSIVLFIHLMQPKLTKHDPNDTVKISYTSGTTGKAKGVLISARQVDKVVESLITP